ncbi:hypothetical protein H7R52_05605 [Weissella confusa]|uniref:Carbamoyl-phosphate synthetase large subunit oligomerisation domain-containing protein n=1 Tax=Weissella confusa TaxID=1583 RepID=A0A923SP08_WEICO|nr:hypothetical protein [Weissella confusa]
MRRTMGLQPVYKMVDTVAAEFESQTPYYYSTYEQQNESVVTDKESYALMPARDDRLFMIADLFRRGVSIDDIHNRTKIDYFFLDKVLHLVELEQALKQNVGDADTLELAKRQIPRWPFDKFASADRRLGTQMKATGEVMAIGRNIEEAMNKAVRSLEIGATGLNDITFDNTTDADLL